MMCRVDHEAVEARCDDAQTCDTSFTAACWASSSVASVQYVHTHTLLAIYPALLAVSFPELPVAPRKRISV